MLRPHSSPFGRVSLEFPQTRELLLRVTLLMLRGNLVLLGAEPQQQEVLHWPQGTGHLQL